MKKDVKKVKIYCRIKPPSHTERFPSTSFLSPKISRSKSPIRKTSPNSNLSTSKASSMQKTQCIQFLQVHQKK